MHILRITIGFTLIDDENKAIDAVHIVTPEMWVLAVKVPDLKCTALCHLKFKVVEGICEKYLLYWLEQAAE